MENESPTPLACIMFGVATRAFPGELVSGDHYVIQPTPNGALVAVVDALGHGVEAATIARMSAVILEEHPSDAVISLLRRCHERLLGTRGAAMSLAAFNGQASTLTWLGVGNVEGVLLRGDPTMNLPNESMLVRGGVVGYQLPPLRPSEVPVKPGDTLVLATDGIRSGFTEALKLSNPPQQIAQHILQHYGKDTDDALVVVVRYLGNAS